jgi:two-component system phosphate regulon response regulator OmpR
MTKTTRIDDDAAHLLVVDDDRRIRDLLNRYLMEKGFRVTTAADAGEARRKLEGIDYDLLIVDVMMPGETGISLTQSLRKIKTVPVIMLTALAESNARIEGLEAGADDYLPKPFEPREMLARLRAILRRRGREQRNDTLRFGRLEIDAGARTARLDGKECALTGYQFSLLLTLAQHAGRVMSRDAIMEAMKNEKLDAFDRSIDVHVSRIRAAIEEDAKKPRRIVTVRGSGYVFAKAQD